MQKQNLNYVGTADDGVSRLESILASIPAGLIVADGNGVIQEFNLCAQLLFGYSKDEAVGMNVRMLLPPSVSVASEARLQKLMDLSVRRKQGAGREMCCLHSSGSEFHAHVSVSEFVDRGRRCFTGIIHNISSRIAMESKLKDAMFAADQASNAKSEFLANMSHEVRTPLNAVMGMLELLQDTKLDARQEKFVQIAGTSATSLLNVISSILDFSKIESGSLSMHHTKFDLSQVVEQSVTVAAVSASGKGLVSSCIVDPDIPRKLLGDATQLDQVVINLVSNAVKFTDTGTVSTRVMLVALEDSKADIRIEVEDTGIGISEQKLTSLFEPFTQVDNSTTRQYGGSGLGLAISKRLVELMGGDIGVISKVGHGSTFWVSLSFEIIAESRNIVSKTLAKEPAAGASSCIEEVTRTEKRILIVDDISANRRVCKEMLRKLGYNADTAANGSEALEVLQQHAYDLVLMDCQMPVMDGYTATRKIRALEQQGDSHDRLPVVALTSHALEGDREASFDAGMDDYLTKPLMFAALESTMERWLA